MIRPGEVSRGGFVYIQVITCLPTSTLQFAKVYTLADLSVFAPFLHFFFYRRYGLQS